MFLTATCKKEEIVGGPPRKNLNTHRSHLLLLRREKISFKPRFQNQVMIGQLSKDLLNLMVGNN